LKRKNKRAGAVRGIGIKWNIFLYLLIFATVIAAVLWLCEIVFLDDIYKNIKINDIMGSAEEITEVIDSPNVAEDISEITLKNDSCSMVFKKKDGYLFPIEPIYCNMAFGECVIHNGNRMNAESFQRIYRYTEKEGGEVFVTDENLYSLITENDEGEELFILIGSEISPVSATVGTLNKILIVVTVLLYALAFVLAILISHWVTKPIRNLTYSALELAKGNYNADFNSEGYLEIAQLAETLNYAQRELSRVDSLRRELIANISHDLRTPLTMIGGYSEMMRDIPGENTPENVQVIIDETNRLTSLVNDVLDISKIESGNEKFEPAPFNLTKSVESMLQRFSKLCEREGYNIEFFCEKDVWVNADELRIGQAVYNLVSNAVTHTGADKKVVVRQITDNGKVRIEVEDFGEGIEPSRLCDIWERYYKVDRVHKRAEMGSGLGLSIVRKIMERSGGGCGVSSALGEGSLFFIELPEYQFNRENSNE